MENSLNLAKDALAKAEARATGLTEAFTGHEAEEYYRLKFTRVLEALREARLHLGALEVVEIESKMNKPTRLEAEDANPRMFRKIRSLPPGGH